MIGDHGVSLGGSDGVEPLSWGASPPEGEGSDTGFSGCPSWAGSSGDSIFWEIMCTFLAGASMVSGEEGRNALSSARVEA